MKKHQDKISDAEMKNLSDRRSFSLSDLPDNVKADQVEPKETKISEQQTSVDDTKEQKDNTEGADVFSAFKRFFSFTEDK